MKASSAVHFVGISGIGMSALARILLRRGCRVSGSSDRATDLTERLRGEGARVWIGHGAEHLDGAQTIVVSSAIAPDNPEVRAARRRGMRILRRGALLAELMADRRGIAVAGTHGKTTTTAMIAAILEAAHLDPTVIVGGERVDTSTNARDGSGEWFVAEADESDGSFIDLRPEIAVVTNIENDHVVSDAEVAGLIGAFQRFAQRVRPDGTLLVAADDARAAALQTIGARVRTFGFAPEADVRATDVSYAGFGSCFHVSEGEQRLGEIALRVPGAINVQNALAAVAVSSRIDIPFATIAAALADFRGVRRRFEVLASTSRLSVVDDYAHHPTAVAATIAAARTGFGGPLVVALEPHRYTRTRYLGAAFARALRAADRVVLTDVYPASEPPLSGVDARSIGEPLRALGGDVAYVSSVAELPSYLLAHAPHGALVLMLGAGSIGEAAAQLADAVIAVERQGAPSVHATAPRVASGAIEAGGGIRA